MVGVDNYRYRRKSHKCNWNKLQINIIQKREEEPEDELRGIGIDAADKIVVK